MLDMQHALGRPRYREHRVLRGVNRSGEITDSDILSP